VMKVILYCFEKLVKFISRNAYIMIAINGKTFCNSTMRAMKNIWKNMFLVGAVNIISAVLLLLGKVAIVVGCVVLTYAYLFMSGKFTTDSDLVTDEIQFLKAGFSPMIVVVILSYVVTNVFFYVYELGIDTLMMCFIEESDRDIEDRFIGDKGKREIMGFVVAKGDYQGMFGATKEDIIAKMKALELTDVEIAKWEKEISTTKAVGPLKMQKFMKNTMAKAEKADKDSKEEAGDDSDEEEADSNQVAPQMAP